METELSFGQTTFLLWVPPFLSYELWKLRIELWKHLVQTGPNIAYTDNVNSKFKFRFRPNYVILVFSKSLLISLIFSYHLCGIFTHMCYTQHNLLRFLFKLVNKLLFWVTM